MPPCCRSNVAPAGGSSSLSPTDEEVYLMETVVGRINRDELKAQMDRHDAFELVDALPAEYFARSHLPGAVNLPYEVVRERAPEVLPDKGADVVLYCMNPT
jgi:hypothetical protein